MTTTATADRRDRRSFTTFELACLFADILERITGDRCEVTEPKKSGNRYHWVTRIDISGKRMDA